MRRRMRSGMRVGTGGAVLCAMVMAAVAPAMAQAPDVAAQIKVIENQPADLDRATWKDRRRDAARKLGQSKDRRAVPVLIKLAETETFDIIGEIAIEALGNLGDAAAAPVLQKIAADPARDKATRELARKALGKLGTEASKPVAAPSKPAVAPGKPAPPVAATPASPTTAPTPTTTTTTTTNPAPAPASPVAPVAPVDTAGGALLGGDAQSAPPAPPVVGDALAAYERLTLAAGTANLAYDTVRKRVDFDADVAGLYQKRIEREAMAWGVNLDAHVVAGYINPEGAAVSRGLQLDVSADGEARRYTGKLYGVGKAAIGAQLNYVSDVDAGNPDNTLKDARFTADLQVALGAGYGRVLDIGAAIRVRRLSRALDAARALGKPIDDATAHRLQLGWWALRGERSTYRALVTTVAILREAGILLGEPDAGLSYEILNVLRDSQLYLRPSGFDVQLAFGEGYLERPDDPPANEEGRVEQLLASAAYGAQLDDDKLELSGTAFGRLRLFAPDDQPAPWAIGATARVRRFAYGDHGDPLGAFDLAAVLQISDDDLMNSQLGQRLTGQLGFTWWMNPASGVRLAANVGEDRGALFIGAELQATYGLLDGTFAR